MAEPDPWWMNGTLFENCNCQLLCPAHVSFRQDCDEQLCLGYWGIHVDKGRFGRLVLDKQNAVVAYQSPQRMHSLGWIVRIYLDKAVEEAQRRAIEQILTGEVGGPWAILNNFVAERLESRAVDIKYEDDGRRKRLRIDGVLDSAIHGLESKKTGEPATLGNLFNVIHSAIQYMARGSSRMNDEAFQWTTEGKHALYSEFSWTGP
jgi:hypothetical protein